MNIKFGERIIISDPNKFKIDSFDEIGKEISIKGSYNIYTQFVESFDNAVVENIISFAREQGVDEVVLIDKKTVLSALEKQIPKKPIDVEPQWCICPACGGSVCLDNVLEHIQNHETTHCEHCGKALDWGDEK